MGEQLSTERRVRALVVDDEPALVRVVAAYLEREGFEVVTAADGVAALALAREAEPDVVVLDVLMPGIDGIEVCRQLRTFSDAYVIMLTARVDEIDTLVGLSIDPEAREVWLDGRPIDLTRTEFDLLDALSSRPGTAFSRAQLIERVWGTGWFGDERLVDIHLGHVRHKLDDDAASPRYVRTVRGVGYRIGPG